ncbi:DUF11 domain-containing protein [Sphingomonas guangdongensis]|nr:DUF11 domain-containing protein [Sphingomonas guangdongensis]
MTPRLLALAALLGLSPVAPATAQTVQRVTNTAQLSWSDSSDRREVSSNTVSLAVDRIKVPTRLSFRLPPVGHEMSGSRCETMPRLRFTPAPVDEAAYAGSAPLETVDNHQPYFIVLENAGGNRDAARREEAIITATSGATSLQVVLLETGNNTGVFAGGISPPGRNPGNAACDPRLDRGARVILTFEEDDHSYGSTSEQLVDPAGYVFDSQTGALVDGAVVTLLDEQNRPAVVYGDDGISRYPATVISGGHTTDSSGRLYDFPQGNYRFPFVAPGKYHLRIQPPARYTAPSVRSAGELARLRDPSGRPFILNGASTGGVFEIVEPDPFYADIPLDREGETALLLTKTASVREASPGDFVQYRVTLENRGSAPAQGVQLTDILPEGLRYERGSHTGAGTPAVSADGRTLNFPLAQVAAGASVEVRYVVSIAPGAPVGEAINRVLASGSAGATSNEAAAAVRIRPLLFTDGFTVTGRVTEGGCGDPVDKRRGVPGIRLLMEDGTFVVTDRDGLYHFEGVRPGRHVVQLDTGSLPASHTPVACDIDTRQAGSAISRFVEADGGLLKRVDFQLKPTGKAAAADTLPIAIADDANAAGNRDWLIGQTPGVEMLFPTVGHNPRAPVLRVAIKHLPAQRVRLSLNGQLVDPLLFDTTDQAGDVAVSRWSGLPLVDGDNKLHADVLAGEGQVVASFDRVVRSTSTAVSASVVADRSRLIADGVTRPLVAVRVVDATGHPVRAGTTLPFRVDRPHVAAVDPTLAQDGTPGAATIARVVGDDGLAFIALEPTTQTGAVRVVASFTGEKSTHDRELRAWLSGAAKDWVVVGFGAGTVGHNTLDRHARTLARADRDTLMTDGQLALYAKGRIKGSWLATIAYDSDRRRDRDRGLLGTIDPNRYYTVYGDGTRQGYDAPTERKLYVRLEAPEFYALFGDYETGLTQSQLGRYSRTLNGGKLAYESANVSVTAFAAHTDELYARDEIPGNGLSGPYRLSGRDIVPNSDKLRIEVRDRFRSELIVSSTALTRHLDYDIDTAMGTIRFRQPVLTRDAAQNPIFIVVDYETYGRTGALVAGGRAAVRTSDRRLEVGATALHDSTVGTANLLAIDVKGELSATTEVRAEAATGGRGGFKAGQAFLVEAEHHGAALDLLAYARQQDQRFGVGQQNVVEAGTRKLGVDGRLRLGDRVSLTTTAWHQDSLETAGTRLAADVRLELQRAGGTLFVGGQLAQDRGIDGRERDSRLLTLGGTQALFDGKLTLAAQTQVAPGGDKASVDFPVRHQVTGALKVMDGVRLLGGYEIAEGADYTAHTAQVGFDVAPWAGGKLSSTLNQQAAGENGQRLFAQYGLTQSLQLGSRWSVDATLDASSTVRGAIPTGAVISAFHPVASGGSLAQDGAGDYAAVTLGTNYRADRWSANGRIEYRISDAGDRFGITASVLRTLGEGKTLASSLRWSQVTQDSGAVASFATADLSVAWRPLDSNWSVLERFELRRERADAGFDDRNVLGVPSFGGGFQATLRAVNNIALNYRTGPEGLGHGTEATLYHGIKWVKGSFGPQDFTGLVNVVGFDLRRDLGRHLDIGIAGSVQHAWERKVVSYSVGPTVGVSPARNLWLTAGYNVAGYRDRDFEADRYTRAGPFITARLKFDQAMLGKVGGR